tara:strand:- start:866 stop:1063 length:198 start_codon:yes stop_codon:yes gene_type:complete
MSTITLVLKLENDELETNPREEAQRIFQEYADRIKQGGDFETVLYDLNGARVGHVQANGKWIRGL